MRKSDAEVVSEYMKKVDVLTEGILENYKLLKYVVKQFEAFRENQFIENETFKSEISHQDKKIRALEAKLESLENGPDV